MDQAYLEWLQGIPTLGAEKARRIADRFPTFEHLRVAARDELAAVEGLTAKDIEAILDLVRPGSAETSNDLFLCPECGSFAGSKADACSVCGAQFGEAEPAASRPEAEPIPAPVPAEAKAIETAYLEWLLSLPRLGEAKARRVASRFPTFEHLRAASPEELESVDGLTPADREALGTVLGDAKDATKGGLFLCPECGSFTGKEASACSVCGAEFGAEEATVLAEADAFIDQEDRLPEVCLGCGAFMSPKSTRCGVCGRERSPADRIALPGVDLPADVAVPFCPHCGAYLYAESDECVICGRSVKEPLEPAVGAAARGVGRGFLSRWSRISEASAVTEEDRLREELDHYDRLLEADPLLEKVWAKRARVLGRLGRVQEAAESLARAAELNPAKDADYRLEVLDVLKASGDRSFLPPRWKQPAATAAPSAVDGRLVDALRHYEDLLAIDPNLDVAWRTKGEILERLGRPAEAREAFARAEALEGLEERARKASLSGLQTRGAIPETPPAGGRVNGRTNGRVNGRAPGHVNGRTNGVSEGRVNGLTNGAVNGLTFGRGATNGLVNGNGFTNGRLGRYGPARVPSQPHWARSVAGIAAVVALMILAPILASLLSPVPGSSGVLRIDRDFGDWAPFPAYVDSSSDQTANPDVNLVATKVHATAFDLFVYAQVQGVLLRGQGSNGTDSLFVLVDEDGRAATGYPVGPLGIDLAAEVYGWDASVAGTFRGIFNGTASPSSDDWNRFLARGTVDVAVVGSEVELRFPLERGPADAKVLVYLADSRGNRDPNDAIVRPARPSVIVEQRTVAPDVVSNRSAFLRVSLLPRGGASFVSALNVSRIGSSTDVASLSLFEDDGSDRLDAADPILASASLTGSAVSLPVNRTVSTPLVFWIEAAWTGPTPGRTFGLRVDDLWTDGSASVSTPEIGLVYLGAAPAGLLVDGAFGDWSGRPYGQDLLGDVVNRTGAVAFNANVDLLATAVDVGANFTAYVRVDGRALGGEDLPTSRPRTAPAGQAVDSDLDGVPDAVEITLPNPDLRFDFDNDNVTDNRTNDDVDGDGLTDYPTGPDPWLNTTIPAWFPAPYAGRAVTRYIGPIAPTVQEGVDVLYAYVDADNSTSTGLRTDLEGGAYGFDHALAVVGRNGLIRAAALYDYAPGAAVPWRFVRPIAAGLDAHRIEFGVDAAALGLQPSYRVVFFASDWRLEYDAALPDASVAVFPVGARAATSVVINEASPSSNPEWVELANPLGSTVSLTGWDLAIVRGNKVTRIFSFSGQAIGAWGSGFEYLRVTLPTNSLPNANGELYLRNGPTIVDVASYGSVASARSWARFKDPLTGVPVDTGAGADFYLSLAPSLGNGNDRHRPTFGFAKTVDAASSAPGDTVTYTVYYNNTDTGLAKNVWVNDTLPAGVTFIGASIAPTLVSGTALSWAFVDVLPNTFNAISVTVTLDAGLADGASLVNAARLAYTDQLRRPLAGIQAWANVTVARPVVTVEKTVSPSNAMAGDLVTFTIYYNNTGSASAGTVSIKDALPSGLTYVSSSPAPTWTDGATIFWNFTDVAPGAYSITLIAQVGASFNGTALVNWVFLNYTTANGFPLESSAASAVIAIPELTDFVFVAAVPLLILVLRRRARKAA